MVKARRPAASQLAARPRTITEPDRQHEAEGQRLAGLDPAVGDRALGGAGHHRVDVGVPPHVEAARRSGSRPRSSGARSIATTGWMWTLDTTMPTSAVKMTSTITRGLSRAKKSETSPGRRPWRRSAARRQRVGCSTGSSWAPSVRVFDDRASVAPSGVALFRTRTPGGSLPGPPEERGPLAAVLAKSSRSGSRSL